MSNIILTTLNARYTHTSIALHYLYANMQELQEQTKICEFTINENIQDIAEKLLDENPSIIGIGVYIWNVIAVHELVTTLKQINPEIKIVIGGPEVSYKPLRLDFSMVDYIIEGEGDIAFYKLCSQIIIDSVPSEQTIAPALVDLNTIKLPYQYFSDHDIKHRYIYVEASRGCPFLCEFCLSSIDEKMRYIDIEKLLGEFETLWQRGARNFKFIDRTFNLQIKTSNKILDFFLSKKPPYFAHFEVIPDHFPESLKTKIKAFPPSALQLEVGIQTLDKTVAQTIQRNLNIKKIQENISFLENETQAHMHLDLIVGLPGEPLSQFGTNLDLLCALSRSEIQIGVLKNLPGTTLERHNETFGMVFNQKAPYDVLKTKVISYKEIQQMKRFSRFWDLLYNSGNFNQSVRLIWQDSSVFTSFFTFSLWIYNQTQSTWKIALERLAKLLFEYLTKECHLTAPTVANAIANDLLKIEGRTLPTFVKEYATINLDRKSDTVQSLHKRQQKRA
jgi:radical SAM superfamily enzyme YgiQ (UPF0313 family)